MAKKADSKGNAKTKTWYMVTSSYHDDGKVVANITGTVEAAEKPKSSSTSAHNRDIYVDYFATKREADKFVEDSKKA